MTPKKNEILIAFVLIGVVGWLALRFQKVDGGDFLEQVRHKHKDMFNDMNESIQKENQFRARIEESISKSDSTMALALIDTLISRNKTHEAYLYKGLLYEKQNKYLLAIGEYNKAIEIEKHSSALVKRADTYIKIKEIDLALIDYKKVYKWNYDYSLQIANAFELKEMKDSALKYYTIYSEHYPSNEIVNQKIEAL